MTIQFTKVARNIRGKFVEYMYTFYEASGGTGGTVVVPLKNVVGYNVTGEKSNLSATLGATIRKSVHTGSLATFTIAYSDPAPLNAVGTVSVTGLE